MINFEYTLTCGYLIYITVEKIILQSSNMSVGQFTVAAKYLNLQKQQQSQSQQQRQKKMVIRKRLRLQGKENRRPILARQTSRYARSIFHLRHTNTLQKRPRRNIQKRNYKESWDESKYS